MIRVKGTELYMYADSKLTKIACVSNIVGLQETMSMRGRATLCEDENYAYAGEPKYSRVTFTTRLTYDTHLLLEIQRSKKYVELFVGLGKGDAPYYENGQIRTPASRSWISLKGQFVDFGITVTPLGIVETPIVFNVSETMAVLPVGTSKTWSNGHKWSNGNFWR